MRLGKFVLWERETIGPREAPYMRRLRIFECPWFRVYFHRIERSDDDRDMHDHPFNFTSIILRGGYIEWRPVHPQEVVPECDSAFLDTAGNLRVGIYHPRLSILHRQAEDLHRIELVDNKPAWTLVFAGRRIREWGFQTASGWINWRRYMVQP